MSESHDYMGEDARDAILPNPSVQGGIASTHNTEGGPSNVQPIDQDQPQTHNQDEQ